jgi:hypothetical protein
MADADPKKITEERSEFRHRLSEGPAGRVWDHDGTADGMAAAMANAAGVFERYGTSFFRLFTGPSSLLQTLTVSALNDNFDALRLYCTGSAVRLAYVFARLRALHQRADEAAAFAQ